MPEKPLIVPGARLVEAAHRPLRHAGAGEQPLIRLVWRPRRNKFRYDGRGHKVFGDIGLLLRHYLAVFGFSADIAYLRADDPEQAFVFSIENTRSRVPRRCNVANCCSILGVEFRR
jgi:hypothetical protein